MYPEFAQIMLVVSGLFLVLSVVAQKVSSTDFAKMVTVLTVVGYLSLVIGILDLIAFIIYLL